MEMVEERQTKLIYHKFYCDMCGEFLGEDFEDENGRYRNPYTLTPIRLSEGTIFGVSSTYEIDGIFCKKCKKKKYEWIQERLGDIGFKQVTE